MRRITEPLDEAGGGCYAFDGLLRVSLPHQHDHRGQWLHRQRSTAVALVVGLGIFKNIATNFIGAPGQAVIAQAFAAIDMQGSENLKHMGSFKATDID